MVDGVENQFPPFLPSFVPACFNSLFNHLSITLHFTQYNHPVDTGKKEKLRLCFFRFQLTTTKPTSGRLIDVENRSRPFRAFVFCYCFIS